MKRHLLPVLFVGLVSFGAAAVWKESQSPEGLRLPEWVPFASAGVVKWRADWQTHEFDLRQLRGEASRLPEVFDPPQAPDIVVIVLDTVRADRMGLYGYGKGTTPKIDAWADSARVYDRMVSDGAWTLPSHASLFTGMPVLTHGARGTPLGGPLASPLAEGTETVASALRQAGYRTVGIAANRAFLDSMWGLAQGFDLWLCEKLKYDRMRLPYVTGDRMTNLAKGYLERPRKEPLFLFLNYMDAHGPWIPRDGYVRDPGAINRRLLPYHKGWNEVTDRLMGDREAPPPAAARAWSEAYDSELRFLDEQVGELLEALPSLGIGDEDYVFVLSDHGEYLGEHALVEHSKDVYQEVLHVPLLVKGPGYLAGRDPAPVQTHDIASWILAAAAQAPLDGAVRTVDLQVSELYWARHRDLSSDRYGDRFNRVRRAYRSGFQKLILGSDGSREAYELDLDPLEAFNVIEDADWVPELEARAKAWLEATKEAPEAKLDTDANLESLKALGYVE